MTNRLPGRLYVVATPIGNLGDLSARARDTLAGAALIAAEDTRHTGTLLKAFGISTPMISLHDHNEAQRVPELIERLRGGASVALVSDAGTPAISDPGFDLVRACAEAGIEVVAVPGPCALVAALSIAATAHGSILLRGIFAGARRGAARAAACELSAERRTLVFYESPHRIEGDARGLRGASGADARGRARARDHQAARVAVPRLARASSPIAPQSDADLVARRDRARDRRRAHPRPLRRVMTVMAARSIAR